MNVIWYLSPPNTTKLWFHAANEEPSLGQGIIVGILIVFFISVFTCTVFFFFCFWMWYAWSKPSFDFKKIDVLNAKDKLIFLFKSLILFYLYDKFNLNRIWFTAKLIYQKYILIRLTKSNWRVYFYFFIFCFLRNWNRYQ